MLNHHGVVFRYLVEVMNGQLAIVLDLGVVEEIPLHPGARRRLTGLGAEFLHDAGDGHKLHHIRIADHNLIQQGGAGCVIMAIDEPWHDRHLPGVERLRPLGGQRTNVRVGSHSGEPAGFDRECLCFGRARIDCIDFCVEDYEIGVRAFGGHRRVGPRSTEHACEARSGREAHEFSAAVAPVGHHWSSPGRIKHKKPPVEATTFQRDGSLRL